MDQYDLDSTTLAAKSDPQRMNEYVKKQFNTQKRGLIEIGAVDVDENRRGKASQHENSQ